MNTHQNCVNTIKGLSIDAVQAAGCGHPGLPMGMADVATVLWTKFLKHDPSQPDWADRDRFVLSPGHGSMLLYSLLHLSGYDLPLSEIKAFRQYNSKTPGHPEYGHTVGVETTTGPLGAGFAMGVGMAISERLLSTRFGTDLVNHYTYAIVSDGDIMEGIATEAGSLAGHLGLGKLIYLMDDNAITIDGPTSVSVTENTEARFQAIGWHTSTVDGHDPAAIEAAIIAAQAESSRPSIICCKTVIGQGSPKYAGTSAVHGAALGVDEVIATKINIGLDPNEHFVILDGAYDAFRAHDGAQVHADWRARLSNAKNAAEFQGAMRGDIGFLSDVSWPAFETGKKLATRKASQAVLRALIAANPSVFGGSADLTGSNGTSVPGAAVTAASFEDASHIHFGIREHAMGAICNGMALHGGLIPYCATFLVFHDYMRPSVRLSALMGQRVIYIYSHDSVFLGEDGPTHQPIETMLAIRAIPDMMLIRPCDAHETTAAWKMALKRQNKPTAIVLTRQGVMTRDETRSGTERGGYTLTDCTGKPDVILMATGSEIDLAVDTAKELEAAGKSVRVVSLPCRELFWQQEDSYKTSVLTPGVTRISIEAGTTIGWDRYIGDSGLAIGIDRFGLSAPIDDIKQELGFTPNAVTARVLNHLR